VRQLVFFILMCCIFDILNAQGVQIEGVVVSSSTGKMISGASVQEESNMINGTITDSAGHFRINVTSNQLIVKHIGYNAKRVSVDVKLSSIVISLDESMDIMNQVVISANKNEKRLKELTMSLEILSPDLVRDKNPVVMDEIINQIPGVQITDGQTSIRAGSGWSYGVGSRVTVLVDGTPLMNGDAGNVLWNFISADHLGSIEVLKGASSVIYGSSALNGIINITSRWPGEKPRSSISIYSGAYSKPNRKSLEWTDKTLNSSGVRIGDSRRVGSNDLNTTIEYVKNDGYRFGDHEERLHLGVDWRKKFKKDMFIGVRSHVLLTDVGSFLLWKSYDSAYNALNDNATQTNGLKFRIDPFWVYRSPKNWLHKINTRFLRVENQVDSGDPDTDQSNSANTYYSDYQATSPVYFGWQVILGALHNRSNSSSPLFGGDHKSTNSAVYAQFEKTKGRLLFNAGARLENYRLDDFIETKPVFRAGLNFNAAKATFLRASFGQGFRFPTIAESYIETKVGSVSVYPNNQLGSETGWNAEIAVKQGFKVKNFKGYIDLAVYKMRYYNMMEFAFSQWSNDISVGNLLGLGFKSVNAGKAEISGIDISVNGHMNIDKWQTIRLLAGFTLSDPISLEPNKQVAIDSVGNALNYLNTSSDTSNYTLKYRSRHMLKWDVQYSGKRWDGGFSIRYNSFASNIDANFVRGILVVFIPGVAEGQTLNSNGTFITDLRWFYKIKPDLRVGLVVSNLFNTEFMIRPANMGPPRLVLLQIRKQFGS
jgi:outer membrane receptor protein involved in Fe transport